MNRYRTQGSLSTYPQNWQLHYPKTCANRITEYSYGPADVTNCPTGVYKVMVDNVTPDYWKRRKAGELIFNPYSSLVRTRKSEGSSSATHTSVALACAGPNANAVYTMAGAYFLSLYKYYRGIPANDALATDSEIRNLQDEIWTKCMANRQSGLTNLSESLAETDKAFAMCAAPFENLTKFIRDFRRHGKRKKGFLKVAAQSNDFISFASSEWLRFRYGVSPLVNDAKAVMKALKQHYNSLQPKLITTRANGTLNRNSVVNSYYDAYPYRVNYGVSRSHQVSVRATHVDKYKPNIFNDLGLTFHNVIGLSWELTHFSFVVDWFANVGDLMYANIPRVGVSSYGGVQTTREDKTFFVYPTGTSGTDPANWTVAGAFSDTYLMTDVSKVRLLRGDNDVKLVIRDDFRFDRLTRVTDAVALAVQVLHSIGF